MLEVLEPTDVVLCSNCKKRLLSLLEELGGRELVDTLERRFEALRTVLKALEELAAEKPVSVEELERRLGERVLGFTLEGLIDQLVRVGRAFKPSPGLVRSIRP